MSGGACLGRGAAALGSVSVGWASGVVEAGLENGAASWASGAERLESGAGGGWESDAGLREQNEHVKTHWKEMQPVIALYGT